MVVVIAIAGCSYVFGPTCGEVRCKLEISTSEPYHSFEVPIEFIIDLSSEIPFSARLFADPLCNLTLRVNEPDPEDLHGFRVCAAASQYLPERSTRDVGPNASIRLTYTVSETSRTPVGPDKPVRYLLRATASRMEAGRIQLTFADDVYLTFRHPNTIRVRLGYQRSDGLAGDENGAFRGYLNVRTIISEGTEKLVFEPARFDISGRIEEE